MPIDRDQVVILIPTLNEAPTIGDLIQEFKARGFPHILVMDGNSRDDTVKIARGLGADVMVQTRRGKGNAIIEALNAIDKPYILMLDGDGTYSPEDADAMLEPLFKGDDHVIGNRLLEKNRDAFSTLNYHGNLWLNKIFKVAHGVFLSDILSGYRGFTRESVSQMHLTEEGFEIETEIAAEAVRSDLKVRVVPVSYGVRPGTATKLDPLHDGIKIATTIWRLARMNNPLFYFGLIGVILMIVGVITGIYVLADWFRQIEHLPLTVLTVLFISVGFQVFMFGVISDMILAYHRDVIHEIQRISNNNGRKER
jgi:dolichol-phosphate mannosyltransferase